MFHNPIRFSNFGAGVNFSEWLVGLLFQGGESRGFTDRVHGISCRYSDKTCKKINYIFTNTYSIIMQYIAHHTSSLFRVTIHLRVFLQCIVIFRRSSSKVEILKTIFVRTCVENYCPLWSNFEMNVCFE